MLNFNYRHVARWTVIAIALLLTFGLQHSTYSQRDQPLPPTAQGDEHRADPCQEHAPKGKAVGWENHCPPVGAGTGIARGDFDGDGFADLAIGVPFDDPLGVVDAGAVNVVYAQRTGGGLSTFRNQYWHQGQTEQGFVRGGLEPGDNFGTAVAAINWNGDQFMDLAIGVPLEGVLGVTHAGAVNILLGGPDGLTATNNFFFHQGQPSSDSIPTQAMPDTAEAHDHFGKKLSWGDFNADGLGDLVVGIPDESVLNANGATIPGAGAVQVFYLRAFGVAAQTLTQESPNILTDAEDSDHFGEALTAGDFNDDGASDLVIGTPDEDLTLSGVFYQQAGVVTVLYGAPGVFFLNSSPPIPNQGWNQGLASDEATGDAAVETGDLFGASLAVGDLNDDGFGDLIIGVPQEDVVRGPLNVLVPNAGALNVVYGSGAGLSRFQGGNPRRCCFGAEFLTQDFYNTFQVGTVDQSEPGDQFGFALATGDFDRDGVQDLAVGAPFEDLRDFPQGCQVDHVDAGSVTVLYSTSAFGVAKKSAQFLFQGGDTAIAQPRYQWGNNYFGFSLTAWNFGNGLNTDLAVGVPGDQLIGFGDEGSCPPPGLPTPRSGPGGGAVEVLYGPLNLAFGGNQQLRQTTSGSVPPGTLRLRGTAQPNDGFGRAVS